MQGVQHLHGARSLLVSFAGSGVCVRVSVSVSVSVAAVTSPERGCMPGLL